MLEETLEDAQERMDSSLRVFGDDLEGFRTNQASPALVSKLPAKLNMGGAGDVLPVNQLALISVEGVRSLRIEPFYPEAVQPVVKAIQESDLGINPQVDGHTVRLTLPELNQERRQEILRMVRRRAEDARVAIRNVRRDAQSMIRDIQREGEASEDDCKRASKTLQDLTDSSVEQVANMVDAKEIQIME